MPKDNTNHALEALERKEPSGTRTAGVSETSQSLLKPRKGSGERDTLQEPSKEISQDEVALLPIGDQGLGGRQPAIPDPQQEGPNTGPLEPDEAVGRSDTPRHATTPLSENEYEADAPGRALPNKTIVGGRYKIMALLGSPHGTNVYRVSDLEGYRQCWACGSSASMEGDVYCVECGAQLTDRFYRLQEFFSRGEGLGVRGEGSMADANPSPLPTAILENSIPGLARVYAIFDDPEASRTYVVWEEVYGRTLASWLPESEGYDAAFWGMSASGGRSGIGDRLRGPAQDLDPLSPTPDPRDVAYVELPPTSGQLFGEGVPGEEQALAWMAQAADTLAALHSQGIVHCNIELANLVIQPGDRLVLIDPTGCQSIHEVGIRGEELEVETHSDASVVDSSLAPNPSPLIPAEAKSADLRNLAAELERWYLGVRQTESPVGPGQTKESGLGTRDSERREAEPVSSRDEITGVLTSSTNPAIVLAKAREGAFGSAEELAQTLYDLYEASRPITNIQLWSGRATDVGQVRQINEDSVLTIEANVLEHDGILPIGVYVVADGMGGHQSGEVASSIAARTIGAMINTTLVAPLVAGDPVACDASTCAYLLQQAVMEANRRIYSLAQERHSDLGTTVTAALVVGNQLTVANVGDSRTYLWREGELAVITKDHSLVAQLVAAGQIAPGEIYTHPRRNEIYRALGDPHLTSTEVDTFSYLLRPGDGVLLCSDGLWDFVRDPIINALIDNAGDPQAICQALVDRANTLGGEDNITTIFVRIVPPKSAED